MFDFLLLLLLAAILLFFFSASVRAWMLSIFLRRVQKYMHEHIQEQMSSARRNYASSTQQKEYNEEKRQQEPRKQSATVQGKLDMDDITAKKFDNPKAEDYVEFEELPEK